MEIKDITKDAKLSQEHTVWINYSKLNKKIRDCKDKQKSDSCRRELEDIGIQFVD